MKEKTTPESVAATGETVHMEVDLSDLDAQNILFLNPAFDARAAEMCLDLLTMAPTESTGVVHVTFTDSPDQCLDRWRHHGQALPQSMQIINIGAETRSATAATSVPVPPGMPDLSIEPIREPGNLTKLGVAITNALLDWDNEPAHLALCVSSLTALLQYADLQTVLRFLRESKNLITRVDGVAHYHADPTAHDERALNTLKTIMDAVVEIDSHGRCSIATKS